MTRELYRDVIFTMIVGLLIILALRPAANVQAQGTNGNWYVEPRTVMIPASADGTGQAQGKVMIDLRTGDIWGFATLSPLPYPVGPNRREPPVVKPVYLGRFDLAAARRE
jgi:hypothetical protein